MAGNAHKNRHTRLHKPCPDKCKYCADRPKFGDYENKNGHRRNTYKKKKQKKVKVQILIG
jgi:hypothetical protein